MAGKRSMPAAVGAQRKPETLALLQQLLDAAGLPHD
jgi:hypothetical protein